MLHRAAGTAPRRGEELVVPAPAAQQVRAAADVRDQRDAGQVYSQLAPRPLPSAVADAVRLLGEARQESD